MALALTGGTSLSISHRRATLDGKVLRSSLEAYSTIAARLKIVPRARAVREARAVRDLLRQVRSQEIDPSKIDPHERRACVAYLRLEGYTQEEIGQIFGVHRQTIARDEKALREEAAKLAG